MITPRKKLIEVKGCVEGAGTVTITKSEILTALLSGLPSRAGVPR